jgi:hypothetical protein
MDTAVLSLCVGITLAIIILAYLYHKYSSSKHPTIRAIRKRLEALDPQFLDVPIKVGRDTYTENKSVVYVCLRHPITGEIYDMNTLMYVTLHELAHVITPNYDNHGTVWQNNFTKLLNAAHKLGIYDPTKPIPKDYCGIESRRKRYN